MSEHLSLFQAYGVELEYMIVDRDSLDIRPLAELVLRDGDGEAVNEVAHGPCAWSNELVAHVVEVKTHGPAREFGPLSGMFQENIAHINQLLAAANCMLLPGGMHPWMNPQHGVTLWPHENREIYQAFDRIFDCTGHGWSNLQSAHLNLPFADDEEFGRLHAAVRLVLPLLPALAASSPFVEGVVAPEKDHRLEVYRHNARRIPEVSGRVIPERAFTLAEYEDRILQPMYRAIAPQDPDGILQEDWLNARGAIARFERQTIEIRVLDVQERPAADLAILALTTALLRALVNESISRFDTQQAWEVAPLEQIFLDTRKYGESARIDHVAYLRDLGYKGSNATAGELWRYLATRLDWRKGLPDSVCAAGEVILEHGCLASRLIGATGSTPSHEALQSVYRELAECLAANRSFRG